MIETRDVLTPHEAAAGSNVGPSDDSVRTRERVLTAAGEVFAERGFRDATVREICRRADANIAAVNYHFGDKANLYTQVLLYADELAMRRHPEFPTEALGGGPVGETQPGGMTTGCAEQLLRGFVRQFVARVFDEERPQWHDVLIERELVEPTGALAELAQKNIKPRALLLQSIVRRLMVDDELRADQRAVELAAASVVGQVMLYHRCRAMMEHLMPTIRMDEPGAAERMAEHISAFSIAAIRGLRAGSRCPESSAGRGHV
jgi:TetR/AcrR family transcriptional regulator, regulator of cefoperazone and chloramphenicol sensitivity